MEINGYQEICGYNFPLVENDEIKVLSFENVSMITYPTITLKVVTYSKQYDKNFVGLYSANTGLIEDKDVPTSITDDMFIKWLTDNYKKLVIGVTAH